MTDSHLPAAGLLRRLPLRGLYPAGYRAAHGEEIAAVLAESVRHADRRTALREWSVLAAHALRLRTRLSSRDPAGRVLAGAAPFLLAGGAALGAVHLLTGLFLHSSRTGVVSAAVGAPWGLALLGALLGRWNAARVLVLVAVVASQLRPGAAFGPSADLLDLWAAMGALVLLAPPDAVDFSARNRARAVASAVAVALPMSGIATLWLGTWPENHADVVFPPLQQIALDASTAWSALVMALAYLLHLGSPDSDRLQTAGVALAVLPWTAMAAPPLYRNIPIDAHDLLRNSAVVLGFLAAATAAGVLRRTMRRTCLAGPARSGASDPM
ncbi:hypothetical protein ACIQOW_38350 [Kitasatospora sp. NPDC091335]|uniref:hypothetical protein n=1 Tax=Kitasatospora sp. NPDC091335 TaxID=3364085 RepID=UPI0038126449